MTRVPASKSASRVYSLAEANWMLCDVSEMASSAKGVSLAVPQPASMRKDKTMHPAVNLDCFTQTSPFGPGGRVRLCLISATSSTHRARVVPTSGDSVAQ